MKKVVYFKAGVVADFDIGDDEYQAFAEQLGERTSPADAALLEQSRQTLQGCLYACREGQMGDHEMAAACFVWRYFNENADPEANIDGDVIVIDEDGPGGNVRYASLAAVQLSPGN